MPRSGGGTKLSEIWAAPIGTGSKFTEVATDNGMVYLGTRDGNVYGFGITGGAALTRSGTAQFSDTAVGASAVKHVALTATKTVTVTGATLSAASSPAPFTLGGVTLTHPGGTPASVTFPVTLHKGDVLRAAVKFAPGAVGGAEGTVSFSTRRIGGPGLRPTGRQRDSDRAVRDQSRHSVQHRREGRRGDHSTCRSESPTRS